MNTISKQSSKASSIKRPRITEKATMLAEHNVFTFEIAKHATKGTVAAEIKAMYNVTPVKVNITMLPAKKVFMRGKSGKSTGVKKAVVYLKKGDSINIV